MVEEKEEKERESFGLSLLVLGARQSYSVLSFSVTAGCQRVTDAMA